MPRHQRVCLSAVLLAFCVSACAFAQTPPAPPLPDTPSSAAINGVITDTDRAAIPGAKIALINPATNAVFQTVESDTTGVYEIHGIEPGTWMIRVTAHGFDPWKVEHIVLKPAETQTLESIQLGVENMNVSVNAITLEDLAEEQITAEVHQRIIGVLPNFYVSYVSNAAPMTRRLKFKLGFKVMVDPVTFMTTGITAGIEQAQGDFAGYGPGIAGYASRYGAAYGDHLAATFFGAALFPSIFHQDPRYFYRGHGPVIKRALYAVSTVVICKGDNGHWQPNFSNVFGNLAAGGISSLYYPNSSRHDAQVTVDNILIGVGTGAIGTLFQEFLLHHFTHGTPTAQP